MCLRYYSLESQAALCVKQFTSLLLIYCSSLQFSKCLMSSLSFDEEGNDFNEGFDEDNTSNEKNNRNDYCKTNPERIFLKPLFPV